MPILRTLRPAPPRAALLLPALAGCLQPTGPGPDLGACAEPPDGVYTYGQLGIGTCLAGPADLQPFTSGGRTLAAVTNADPFRNFTSGSLLILDLDVLEDRLEAGDRTIPVTDLAVGALPMESFVGGFAIDALRQRAYVTSRLSPDTEVGSPPDKLWVVDLADPTAPAFLADRPFVTVRQDPFEVTLLGDRAYVLSPADASVAVVDLAGALPALYDPSPASLITPAALDDTGPSSTASLTAESVPDREVLVSDQWTARWIEGTTRIWAPAESPDGPGLARWTTGRVDAGPSAWVPAGIGVEIAAIDGGLDTLTDPWLTFDGDALAMHVADGNTLRVAATDGSAGAWAWLGSPVMQTEAAWAAQVGGPAVVGLGSRVVAYFDGRPDIGETGGAIGRAITVDGLTFLPADEPLLTPAAPWVSYAQPSVFLDPVTGGVRMWMSASDGERWVIVTSTSSDGATGWTPPEPVVDLPGASAGAPWVVWTAGVYRMIYAVEDGGTWSFVTSTSPDGVDWSAPTLVQATQVPVTSTADGPDRPPRPAVQVEPTAGWRVEGIDTGTLVDLYPEGGTQLIPDLGFSLRFASGYLLDTALVGARAATGLEPGSAATVQGLPTLYATVTDADGRPSLSALRPFADTWGAVGGDLIPAGAGDNVLGAESPSVFATGLPDPARAWALLYGARDAAGSPRLRLAWSADGLDWTPEGRAPMAETPTMAVDGVLPHAIERLDGGGLALWYAGFDGGRWRIGRALSEDDGATWTPDPGPADDGVVFPPGPPGAWDDSGVRDPTPVTCADTAGLPGGPAAPSGRALVYAGFDGANWGIGLAWEVDGTWVRRTRPFSDDEAAALSGLAGTFAAAGARSPVLWDADTCALLWAGNDGVAWRTGAAALRGPDLFPTLTPPQGGDTLSFATFRGEEGTSVINLGQRIEQTPLPGFDGTLLADGPIASAWDASRGLLYIVSKGYPGVIALDLRDDSAPGAPDLNVLDIEAVLRMQTTTQALGFHDIVFDAATDRLYLAAREPDAIYIASVANIVDDADKEVLDQEVLGALPMKDLTDDAGDTTFAGLGAAGITLVPGQDLLIATHFRDNSVSIFDLNAGIFGEEIRYLADIGENPHLVRLTPDGRFALVLNYLGAVSDGEVGSSIAIIDLRPEAPTWLQVIAALENQAAEGAP